MRNAVNMVNGMSVNGLGEVSMDTTQTLINNNLMANNLIALVDPSQHMSEAAQPNIHPGCIPSTGRGKCCLWVDFIMVKALLMIRNIIFSETLTCL